MTRRGDAAWTQLGGADRRGTRPGLGSEDKHAVTDAKLQYHCGCIGDSTPFRPSVCAQRAARAVGDHCIHICRLQVQSAAFGHVVLPQTGSPSCKRCELSGVACPRDGSRTRARERCVSIDPPAMELAPRCCSFPRPAMWSIAISSTRAPSPPSLPCPLPFPHLGSRPLPHVVLFACTHSLAARFAPEVRSHGSSRVLASLAGVAIGLGLARGQAAEGARRRGAGALGGSEPGEVRTVGLGHRWAQECVSDSVVASASACLSLPLCPCACLCLSGS